MQKENNSRFFKHYFGNAELINARLKAVMPAIFVTTTATTLLQIVDSVILGNFVNKEALAAVNILSPFFLIINAASYLLGVGISSVCSVTMGTNDQEKLKRNYYAAKRLKTIFILVLSILQIPLMIGIINSLSTTPELKAMTWMYAIPYMFALPLQVIKLIGAFELNMFGKVKLTMVLGIIECLTNAVISLMLVGVFRLGTLGGGISSFCAISVTGIITIFYLKKKTNYYECEKVKCGAEIKSIIISGFPRFTTTLLISLQSTVLLSLIGKKLGVDGLAVRSVCTFANTFSIIIFSSILNGEGPLMGVFHGARNLKGKRSLMKSSILIEIVLGGILTVFVYLVPQPFFKFYGYDSISSTEIMILRIYALFFVFNGINSIIRSFFTYSLRSKLATVLAILKDFVLVVPIGFLCQNMLGGAGIWFCYPGSAILTMIIGLVLYLCQVRKDIKTESQEDMLYLSLHPDEAAALSEKVMEYFDKKGAPREYGYKAGLLVEESAAYVKSCHKQHKVSIDICISHGKDNMTRLLIFDNGMPLDPTEQIDNEESINNVQMIKKMASTIEYQRLLDLNYTILTF